MAKHPDILILGGGVIGLTTAYFLARAGLQVDLLDKGDFGQEASWAGAGILPPGNPKRARTPYDQLRAHSAVLHPALAEELRERTGIDNGYRRCGGLEFLAAEDAGATDLWRDEGIAFEALDESASRKLEPELAPGLGNAFFLPELSQVRNPRHVKALRCACESLGVGLHVGCQVHGFQRDRNHIGAVRTSAGLFQAGQFLLAAGAWSDSLLGDIGSPAGIRPVRGQIVLLNSGASRVRRVLMKGARYLVPRPDGRVLIGSTEEDAGFDKRTTAEAVRELLSFGLSLVPCLAEAPLERCWAGLRPGSPDGMPFLGPVPGFDNLLIAAGHFRAGIQLSPATALVMKELILGQPTTVPLEAFRLDRAPVGRHVAAFRS